MNPGSPDLKASALTTGPHCLLLKSKKELMVLRLTGDKKRDTKEDSIDTVLQYHQKMQEDIAEEMIGMAKNLKHTSIMASNIIKEDNKVGVVFTQL